MKCPVCGQDVPGVVAICWPKEPVLVLPEYSRFLDDKTDEEEKSQ